MFNLITFNNSFAARWDGPCSGWTKELVTAYVTVDLIIAASYMMIPALLIYLLLKGNKSIPFNFLFASFIVTCGLTHVMNILTSFYPYYYLDFFIKTITAIASATTAIVFWWNYKDIVNHNPFKTVKMIEQENVELNKANKELENFALVAAHDLQDPIKQSQVFLRLIQQGRTEFIPDVINNNIRLNEFVKRLLEFARHGTNLKLETVPFQKLVGDTLSFLQLRIEEVDAKVEVVGNFDVTCDRIQLGRVFQNLLSNSLKHKHPDRPLMIRVEAKNPKTFSVKDNGVGIPEEQMQNLFIVYRGKKRDSTGAGFGLAIAKRIVESHMGTIRAQSKVGVGTEFVFTID